MRSPDGPGAESSGKLFKIFSIVLVLMSAPMGREDMLGKLGGAAPG